MENHFKAGFFLEKLPTDIRLSPLANRSPCKLNWRTLYHSEKLTCKVLGMKIGSGSYYSPPSVQNGVLSPSDYSDEVNAVTWKRFGEHWGTGIGSSDAYLQQWMSRSMTGAASGESLLFQLARVIARCSLQESKTLLISSSLNFIWKLTGLE